MAILPDYKIFAKQNPSTLEFIKEKIADPSINFKIIVVNEDDRDALFDDFGESELLEHRVYEVHRANKFNHMLVGSPHASRPDGYLLVNDDIIPNELYRVKGALRDIRADPQYVNVRAVG